MLRQVRQFIHSLPSSISSTHAARKSYLWCPLPIFVSGPEKSVFGAWQSLFLVPDSFCFSCLPIFVSGAHVPVWCFSTPCGDSHPFLYMVVILPRVSPYLRYWLTKQFFSVHNRHVASEWSSEHPSICSPSSIPSSIWPSNVNRWKSTCLTFLRLLLLFLSPHPA